MVVGKQPSICSHLWWPEELGPTPIPKAKVKNLGVWFDNTLSFSDQIAAVTRTCFGILKMLRKILDLLPLDAKRTIVQALLTSRLDYCNILYLRVTKINLNILQKVQNAAARLILNIPRRALVKAALRELHWLPIQARVTFKVLCFGHKILNEKGPSYLRPLLTAYRPTWNLRSLGTAKLIMPKVCRVRSGGSSFSFLAAKAWNDLPMELRTCPSETMFWKKIENLALPISPWWLVVGLLQLGLETGVGGAQASLCVLRCPSAGTLRWSNQVLYKLKNNINIQAWHCNPDTLNTWESSLEAT